MASGRIKEVASSRGKPDLIMRSLKHVTIVVQLGGLEPPTSCSTVRSGFPTRVRYSNRERENCSNFNGAITPPAALPTLRFALSWELAWYLLGGRETMGITLRAVQSLGPGETIWDAGHREAVRGFGRSPPAWCPGLCSQYRASRQRFFTIGPHGSPGRLRRPERGETPAWPCG